MKNFLKYILAVVFFISGILNSFAGKNDFWTLHPTFDLATTRIIPGNRMVYFLAPAQPYYPTIPENAVPQHYIYRYDSAQDEFSTLTSFNLLSETIVKDLVLNAHRGYAMAIYESGNIDLLFDNGKVENIPGLMNANIPSSKNINSVTFDHYNNRAYIATDFGFVEINDSKREIADSRNYSRKLLAFGRLGNQFLAVSEDSVLYQAPTTSAIRDFGEFSPVKGGDGITALYPLTPEVMVLTRPHIVSTDGKDVLMTEFLALSFNDNGSPEMKTIGDYQVSEIEECVRGYTVTTPSHVVLIGVNAQPTLYGISASDKGNPVGTWDQKKFWFSKNRQGFYMKELTNGSMVTKKELYMPNSSAAFKCTAIQHHPSKGLLVSNHGNNFYFQGFYGRSPILLSALKNDTWQKIGLPYTNAQYANVGQNPNGMAIDPNYPQYVYFGSMMYGITRMNLNDPNDVLHMTGPNDGTLNFAPGAIICEAQEAFSSLNHFSDPHFDASGNLWTTHTNMNAAEGKKNELWVWPRANSAATKDHKDVKPWLKISPPTSAVSTISSCLPLKHSSNKNLVIISLNSYSGEMVLVDHKGTLDNTSDDTFTVLPVKPVDQDGQTINRIYIRCMYEDPQTGLVWITTDSGVFTFNPRTAQQNPNVVNRIKVARNDGTSLADYLLNGVDVFHMTSDPQGHKWFSTNGAGLVCTSADGKTVIGQYTTDNSGIPSDEVYAAGWNPENGTIMVSSALGLAELAPYGNGTGENLEAARAFPNPVRPDYFGWVTIDGLVDNALVKIADAEGNIVRELGHAAGGSLQWDICDMNLKRVKSGVYYVLASSGPDSGSMAKVTKLLVVN